MKVARPHVGIAVVSAVVVLLVAIVDVGRTSPGPLTIVHERQPELVGRDDCGDCHGGWTQSMSSACLECHAVIGAQMDDGAGLHGTLGTGDARRCARCHSDHHGPDFAVINARSFALAGVPNAAEFEHELVGFAMDGSHLELDCSECHEHADERILPPGGQRFLGLHPSCSSCHSDPHDGGMVRACTDCHDQTAFDALHSRGHDEPLPLAGGHAGLDCRECHDDASRHALEVLVGRGRKPPSRDCLGCHESPHTASFITRVARLAEQAPEASCVECHAAEHASFRGEIASIRPMQHAASGFPLATPHDRAACGDCHAPDEPDFAARYAGRSADACAACHEDPHAGQFDAEPWAERGCIACHDRERFDPPEFGRAKHAFGALPLTGSHVELDCDACHLAPADDGPRVFHDTPSRCDSCHEDAHAGFFEPGARGECARCHRTTTFDDVPAERFDHEHWTGFAVLGAHAQSDCDSCHDSSSEPDNTGRTLGRVADHFGPFEGCATCHADPHEGRFDVAKLPRNVDGKNGCERCHVQASFRAFPDGFDHELWTGFALLGSHSEIGCTACHMPPAEPSNDDRAWGSARGDRCADCHRDPHAGQFKIAGQTDCGRCHESTGSFQKLLFRHNDDSRFALEDAHSKLACAACHKAVRHNGLEIVRYRPLGMECSDCHGVHAEALRRRRGRDR